MHVLHPPQKLLHPLRPFLCDFVQLVQLFFEPPEVQLHGLCYEYLLMAGELQILPLVRQNQLLLELFARPRAGVLDLYLGVGLVAGEPDVIARQKTVL